MDKVLSLLVVGLFIIFLSVACSGKGSHETQGITINCPPLPSDFKDSDLFGTWIAKYGDGDTDTLILKDDGTYKQIYHHPDTRYSFESDWQEWWVEHRDSGLLRLHLKDMHRCDGIGELCERQGGGLGGETTDIDYYAIDYCENESVKMPDEIILVVTGVEAKYTNVLRNIWLRQMRLPGSEWSYSFELQK